MSTHDLTICIPSHRPNMLVEALASAQAQRGVSVQIMVNASAQLDADKFNAHPFIAGGEFVCTLCDDDLLHPDFAQAMVKAARDAGDAACCGYQEFGLREHYVPPGAWTQAGFRARNPMGGLTFLLRTALFRELGGFDMTQLYADWDLGYRAFRAGARATMLDLPYVSYRHHAGNGHRGLSHRYAMELLHRKHPELGHGQGQRTTPREYAALQAELRSDFSIETITDRETGRSRGRTP